MNKVILIILDGWGIGDKSKSDAIAQALYNAQGAIAGHKSVPVGVAHLGIFDTVLAIGYEKHDIFSGNEIVPNHRDIHILLP